MSFDDLREFVKRYLVRQVVNMVYTDVASEPHQWNRQVVVGATMCGVLVRDSMKYIHDASVGPLEYTGYTQKHLVSE